MKDWIIIINWSLSFFGLGMESVNGGMLWSIIGFTWFMISTLIVLKAQKRGLFSKTKH